jgi:glutamyl-tRNA(Gln) amidotransferase subunit E
VELFLKHVQQDWMELQVFSRPKPGSSRMYPETDIPYISIDERKAKTIISRYTQPWNEIIDQICKKYNNNKTLAENIFDSKYFSLFRKNSLTHVNKPLFCNIQTY